MIHAFFDWLRGYYLLLISRDKMAEFANAMFQKSMLYTVMGQIEKEGDVYYQIKISMATQKKMKQLEDCASFVSMDMFVLGLPKTLIGMKKRIGVPIGIVFAICIYAWLSAYVWEVRIEGLPQYDEDRMLESMKAYGLHEGAILHQSDLDRMATAYLEEHQEMAWMNIQKKGTVITIYGKLTELGNTDQPSISEKGANLIASRDAIIEEFIIEKGRPVVMRGEVVAKGDLLVSGIYESANGTYVTMASGEVRGKVTQTLQVFAPYETTQLSIYNTKLQSVTISVFDKSICLFSRKQNEQGSVVASQKQVYLFDKIRLPISVETQKMCITQETTQTHTETDTMKKAYEELNRQVALLLQNGELVSKNIEGRFTDAGYEIICQVTYIENIAETLEFSTD